MRRDKKSRMVISVMLSFFLTVCIFCLMFILENSLGFLSTRRFEESMAESNYIETAVERMTADVHDLLESKGIADNFTGNLEYGKYYAVAKTSINQALQGKAVSTGTQEWENNVREYLHQYMADEEVYVTEGIETAIEETVYQSRKIYQRYMQPQSAVYFWEWKQEMKSIQLYGCVISVLGIVLVSALLFRMYHYKHRALRYVTLSVFCAVIWNIACVLLGAKADILKALGALPDYYIELIDVYVSKGFVQWKMMSGICFVLVFVLCVLGKALKRRNRSR